ncbi:hypothetical protein ENUP19_0054G0061 [Entamoeba nuttalli]|uniref:VWFA domain-containing protein n=2 Tax=Entamoeba nuttalli TaxID=412467 RepID=K2H5C9_ENTNP|nr:hypothetical protein ENU1_010140 [Entamoeba nuttalli P19]EKE42793.1 hypothetical protein ENU1_010140 [Entamoeba nuttalli P19]|eukprot:XP_008854875.1 hypothetical protein ENU1_010140 [Entamoeba nuttalli P19]
MSISNTVLFAFTDSASVTNNEFYWNSVNNLYQDLVAKYGVDNVKIIAYSDNYIEIDRIQLNGMIQRKRGDCGGYCMTNISRYIHNNSFKDDLVIVTDGQGTSVEQAKLEMQQHGKIHSSNVYIIGENGNSDVVAPFIIQSGSKVYSVTSEGTKLIIETEEDERSTFLGIEKMTVKEFLENFDRIYNYITKPYLFGHANLDKTRTMYNNESIKNILMKEKSRLVYEYGQMNKGNSEKILIQCINEADFITATREIDNIVKKYYDSVNSSSQELTIEERIDKLIELCGVNKVNRFNKQGIRSNRDKRAKQVKNANLDTVTDEGIEETSKIIMKELIECPLNGEEDVPVLLVTGSKLLNGIAKNVINEIISCPFNLINYPAIKQSVISSLGGFVSLKSVKETQLLESTLTGKPVIGAIILSTQKQCLEITKSTIARMFTDGKLLGAPSSYLIAIYEIIKNISEYENILLTLKKVIIQMLQNSQSNASMSGNVSQICIPLRADVSLWFIAHSCLSKIPPANNPFILHLNHMPVIFDVLEMLEYPINEKVRKHYVHFVIVQTLHRMKFINSDTANCFMKALYQKAIFINKNKVRDEVKTKEYYLPFVFVDGKADQEQIDFALSLLNPIFKKVSVEEVITLNSFAHEKWKVEKTDLPIDLIEKHPQIEENWNEMSIDEIKEYDEKMKRRFIKKYGFEPTRDEFLLFLSRRVQKGTIPNI